MPFPKRDISAGGGQRPIDPREPETRALLRLLRTGGESPTAHEWALLTSRALRDGLGGLALEVAAARGLEVPLRERLRLEHQARQQTQQARETRQLLAPLIAALHRCGLRPLLLKGAALDGDVYPRGVRPMSDIDLLVLPKDALVALEVLKSMGCRTGQALVREDFFPRFYYETELLLDRGCGVRIDLHARPLRPLRFACTIPDDAMWEGAAAAEVEGELAFVPSAENMLLHLSAHTALHGCSRLIWLYDLVRYLDRRGGEIDWTLFLERAASWRIAPLVSTALTQAEAIFGERLPGEVRSALRRAPANWRDRWILRQAPRDAASPAMHVLSTALCTPDVRLAAGFVAAHLLPSRTHLAETYPYRHAGWPVAAQCRRLLRKPFVRFGRAQASPGESPADSPAADSAPRQAHGTIGR